MPSSRRLKVTGLIAVLTVLIILYITNGAKQTYHSPFYTRTKEAIKARQDREARQNVIAEEQARLDRVERLQKEHDVAVSVAAAEPSATSPSVLGGDAAKVAGADKGAGAEKPLAADIKEAASKVVGEATATVKPVAGRKTMQAGKVVESKPGHDTNDGVAKVGNVEPHPSKSLSGDGTPGAETEEEHKVETELNDILKKGPIIIFSKSYCPFSKKAKHILLDLYSITPPPYVVELDQHELGSGLQSALQKSTGRRTVPNVLINGKSIGGGDDVEALHNDGKLIETVTIMGGKRIVEMKAAEAKTEVKFKA